MEPPRILLVDQEGRIAAELAARLQAAGYTPVVIESLREAVGAFLETQPQAIVLRDTLPSVESWEVAQRVREMSPVPIIFVSERRDLFAMERALLVGDDYVTPPFNWDRLIVKLAALLHRRKPHQRESQLYDDGHLVVDFTHRTVQLAGRPVHLTDTEFRLLSCFIRWPNRVLTYDELLTQVWGHTHFGAKSHVSLYVRYLRRKLEDDPANPVYFITEWGVGYSFRPRSAAASPPLSDGSAS